MPLNGKRGCILVSSLLVLGIAAARAQDAPIKTAPATENVTVTGTKPTDAAINKFVEALTVPTRAADKLARWRDGVCPLALGMRPEVGAAIVKKIREIAASVGAPVNTRDGCPNNIEVIFTAQPQALLDDVRVMHPNLLGYFDNSAQAEQLATMRAPIQSWYITATVDRHGQVQVDGARKGGVTITMMPPQAGIGGPSVAPTMFTMNLPNATAAAATDGRLGDGISSTITNVVIVADTSKLLNREVGVLADYIAMLALSQVRPPDGCQDMPTILNLLVPDCSRAAGTLTAADLAYLKGLYKMTPTANVRGQRDEIRYQMNKSLLSQQ
jgi:hypothetical protein